jgi:nicotinamidase-related amidase
LSDVLFRPGSSGVMLLCLDALRLSADSDGAASYVGRYWHVNAAQLLGHAREQGWAVAHVVSRRPRPGETPWRPLQGLGPEPCEPVYHREQPSAFSSPELRAALTGGPRREVVLCGVSAQGSALATALDALRYSVRLTLASDAASLQDTETRGLDGLLQLQRFEMAGACVRLATTDALIRPWRGLSLLQGGRR